jgi:hypothetical protein
MVRPPLGWKRKIEGSAAIHNTLGPGLAAMAVNDTTDVRQPYAGALEVFCAVETLEDAEEFVGISHVESDAVIANKEHRFVWIAGTTSNLDFGLRARPRILQSVRK